MSPPATLNGVMAPGSYDERILTNRDTEYAHLRDNTYLDNAESVPYPRSLVVQSTKDLTADFLITKLPTSRIDAVRSKVLDYFKADSKYFDVVFTQNATEAVKLVMQSCQEHRFRYLYHKDAQNSLVGIREVARGGSRCLRSDLEVEDWLENGDNTEKGMAHDGLLLFGYPAQSNMTGHRLPLTWAQRLRKSHLRSHRKAYTLLDASTYLVTGHLDLSDHEETPDFISLSFSNIFGYPDLGALIVRRSAGRVLTSRRYFGAGVVELVLDVDEQTHVRKEGSLHTALEDGPLPSQSIIALENALTLHKTLFGTPNEITRYTERLTKWLHSELTVLRHFTGTPVVQVYNEANASYNDTSTQGAIIAFNLRDANRNWISATQFEKLANACGIQLSTGDMSNPGGLATMLELKPWEVIRNFYEQLKCGKDLDVICDAPTGVIRVSLGPMTTMKDVSVFAAFIKTFFVQNKAWQPKSSRGLVEFFETDLSEAPDDNVEIPVPETKSNGMMIQPIQGCNLFPLTQQHDTAHRTESAYKLWNNEWCILNKATGMPIDPNALELEFLQVSVLPDRGFLKITSLRDLTAPSGSGGKSPARDQSPRIMGNTLKIDLWAPPAQSETSVPLKDGRIADPYPQPEITSFFTAALNTPCTLARFRPSQAAIQKRRRTCVVPKCRLEFPDSSLLAKHHEAHVEDFDKEKRRLSKKEKADRPPALTITTEGETSSGLGRSNSKLFRSNSKRVPKAPLSAGLAPSRPYSPIATEPERKSLDYLHKEVGLSPVPLPLQPDLNRANSKSKGGAGGLLRSLSKRHGSNPTPPSTSGGADVLYPPSARKSLDRLHVYAPTRLGHDRAKSEQHVMTTPLINVEDTDMNGNGLNGGLAPMKVGWVKRHLSVRSAKERRMVST
jgi:molybdenum cofactor sulfurtransferase